MRFITPLILAAALVVPASASAAPRPADLWATINICDTARHPDQMGVRASMPGNGRVQRMYMRFRAQFFTSRKKWQDVGGSATSRWVYAGSARLRNRQAGYTFKLKPPRNGAAFVLRSRVDFQWRERKRSRRTGKLRWVVVRRARANTKAGFEASGADPPGFSAGLCEIR